VSPPLTPRLLNIPAAVVANHAIMARRARVDSDDVLSLAEEALVQSWRDFDPEKNPDGEAGLAPFLYGRVRNRVHAALRAALEGRSGRGRTRSLDQGRPGDGLSYHAALGRCDPGPALVDSRETVERWLALLPGRQAQAVRLIHLDGLTTDEAGRQLGTSGERARQIAAAGLARLRHHLSPAQ